MSAEQHGMAASPQDVPRPCVSVILRSMNRPTLAAALDSIRSQTYRPIEVVVVNASGRPHSALPNDGEGLRWRLVGGETALSRAEAANAGLQAASGDGGLNYLDDDDLLLPDHLDKLAHALRLHLEAPAVYSDVDYGEFGDMGWRSRHCFAASFDRQRLLFENYLPIHAVMFRRFDGCVFDERFDVFEDWDFWLQLSEHGAFVHVPGVSARYVGQSADGSGVFKASDATAAARRRLHDKWYRRLGPDAFATLMDGMQALYRAQAQAQDSLAASQAERAEAARTIDALQAIVRARDAEIADRAAGADDLRRLVAARDAEIANAAAMVADLRHVVAARETELANMRHAHDALQALQRLRDAEGPLTAFGRALKRKLNEHR